MIANNFYNIGFENSLFKQNKIVNFEPEYIAILDRATALGYSKPTPNQQKKQNAFLKNLKSLGIWTRLDYFFVGANDGGGQFACINWKNPTAAVALLVNSPTFTTNAGFNSNGSSSYIDTQFNASTQGVNFTNTSAGEFCYQIGSSFGVVFGTSGGAGDGVNVGAATTGQRLNMFGTNLLTAADMSGSGFKCINRTSATNVELFNETTQITRTTTIAARINANRRILNGQNVFLNTPVKIAVYGNGGNLTDKALDLRLAIIAYLTSL